MAVGDIGLGEAFVINWGPQLNRTMERQQAILQEQQQRLQQQRQRENQELSELVGKINPNGLRREDIDDFSGRYQAIKDKYLTAINAGSDNERRKIRADIQQELADLNTFIGNSKATGQGIGTLSTAIANNREQYSDDVIAKVRELSGKPTSQINVEELNPLNWERQVDTSKVIDDIQKGITQRVNSARPEEVNMGRYQSGNVTGTRFGTVQSIAPEIAGDYIYQRAQADPTTQAYLKRKYPDITLQEAAVIEAGNYNLEKFGSINRERDRAPERSSSSDTQSASTYRQQIITDLTDPSTPPAQIKQTIEEINAYLPEGSNISYKTASDGNRYIDFQIARDRRRNINATTERVDLQRGNPANRLNAIIGEFTGERVSGSKLNTEGAKPRGNRVNLNTPQNSVTSQNDPLGLGL